MLNKATVQAVLLVKSPLNNQEKFKG